VCVLYTLPVARPDDDESRRVIEDYNVMVRDMSFEAGVLLIDAYEILNRNLSGGATHLAKGRLQTSGYEALNDEFLRTYRLLERVVMRRDVAVPPLRGTQAVADASNAPDGSAAGVGGASPTKPDAPLATAPGALSLLVNGGFEDADAETRFAAAWQPYPVGAQRAGRLDQSHPHGGDRALVIRLAAGRQESGAYTTLSLEPGTYVLRYWACSDVGATARVSVHVAGRECTPDALDEDWRQFSHTVLVEEKLANTSVRICSVTPSVRVWLDDVELTRVRSERP
jgi:hypothetical protein